MKKIIFSVIASTILFSQIISVNAGTETGETSIPLGTTTQSTSTGDILDIDMLFNQLDNEISTINKSITGALTLDESITGALTLDAAPVIETGILGTNYTSWELMHRTPMISGFAWTGVIANYITPQMYIGTLVNSIDITNPLTEYLVDDSTSYADCLQNEVYISYGLGERIEDTDIKELKAIAKTCAKEFYGPYFNGKSYTTREEFLMMMFTIFEEDVIFEGQFSKNGRYIPGTLGIDSHFSNVSKKAWYSPYLALADDIAILPIEEEKWKIAKEITDREAVEMLALYTAYRMNFEGTSFDRGMIITTKFKYSFEFQNEKEIGIKVQ